MKKILFTTILLVAGVVCVAFGIRANSITMSILSIVQDAKDWKEY